MNFLSGLINQTKKRTLLIAKTKRARNVLIKYQFDRKENGGKPPIAKTRGARLNI